MNVRFNIELNSLQKEMIEAYNNPSVNTVIGLCSRQIGKTTSCEIISIMSLFIIGNRFNAWFSPTFRQAKKVFRELSMLIPKSELALCNASDLIIQMKNGNVMQFFSAESLDTFRGFTVNGVVIIDEAAFFPNTNWLTEVVMPSMKNSTNKKLFLISTPNGKQGTFYEYYIKALNNEKGIYLIEKDIYSDSLVSMDTIEEIKRSTPPHIFEQEYLVKFIDDAITVFKGFDNCFHDYLYNTSITEWCGIDLSTVGEDKTVISFINNDMQTIQYQIPNEIPLDKKYDEIAKIINARKHLLKGYIEMNSIGEPMFNEIKKKLNNKTILERFITTNDSKSDMVSLLSVKIANNEISFNNENKALFGELGTFTYKLSTNTRKFVYGAKNGFHDDFVMSLCMALKCKEDFRYSNQLHFIKRNK